MSDVIKNSIDQMFKDWYNLTDQYANLGASDTEPDMIFQRFIHNVVHKPYQARVPEPEQWELYYSSDRVNCLKAGRVITEYARFAKNIVKDCCENDFDATVEALKPHLWRS